MAASLSDCKWQTAGWNWLLIYEIHAQRFTQRNVAALSDFGQVKQELQGGYLSPLPVTALELLPLHEVPSDQAGWGYNPTLFFAIESSYGGPQAFAEMVSAAHNASLAIIVDVVYNHLIGSPLQVLARDVYVNGETQWGDMAYFAHPAACEFFRQPTVFLWSFFRLDGFRFDSTDHHQRRPLDRQYAVCHSAGTGRYVSIRGWQGMEISRHAAHSVAPRCRSNE